MSFNSSSRNVPSCDCPLIRFPLVLPCAGQVSNGWIGKVHWFWFRAGERWLDWKSWHVHLLGTKNQYACNIFGSQNSSWCPSLVAWSSIPRVMQYYLYLETFGLKKNVQNLNLPKVKTQELQFQSWRKIVVFHPFVAIQYNECRWMLILNRMRW